MFTIRLPNSQNLLQVVPLPEHDYLYVTRVHQDALHFFSADGAAWAAALTGTSATIDSCACQPESFLVSAPAQRARRLPRYGERPADEAITEWGPEGRP